MKPIVVVAIFYRLELRSTPNTEAQRARRTRRKEKEKWYGGCTETLRLTIPPLIPYFVVLWVLFALRASVLGLDKLYGHGSGFAAADAKARHTAFRSILPLPPHQLDQNAPPLCPAP